MKSKRSIAIRTSSDLGYVGGNFYLASHKRMLEAHLDLYTEKSRKSHIDGASCLVELGAGYGSKLLGLGRREPFSTMPLAAGEHTARAAFPISAYRQTSG